MAKHKKHFVGSTFWMIFWIILCFPVAIFYWVVRQEELSEKELEQKEKRNWIKKHPAITFFLFLIGIGMVFSIIGNLSNPPTNNSNEIVSMTSNQLLPQENEIDLIWEIDGPTTITIDFTGFIEASELKVTKSESYSGTSVIMKIFKFDSIENAQNYYDQQIETIRVRGVEELSLGGNCFGIDQEAGLAGIAQGYCLEKNIVIYLKSASSSFMYTSDLKDFKKIILKKF